MQDRDNGKERRLLSPRANYSFDRCDPSNYRSSPHLDYLVIMDQHRLTKARENFVSLSTKDKALILADLYTLPVPVQVPAAPTSCVVSMVTAFVEALDIPKVAKRGTKISMDFGPDSEDEKVDRFARLTSFGSQELRKFG